MILSLYASCSSNFQLVFKRNPLLHQFFSSLLSSISLGKSRHLKPIELKFCASLRFVGGAARVISTSGTFRATFVSEYVWPKTSKSHVTRLQWSRSLFAVHVWTLDKAVSGCGTFFLLVQKFSRTSYKYMWSEVFSLQSIRLGRKKTNLLSTFCVWNQGLPSFVWFKLAAHMLIVFFKVKADVGLKS